MTAVVFKEWLPDQPALGNPGLIRAENVIPSDGFYRQYSPLSQLSAGAFTLPGLPRGGFTAEVEGVANPYCFYAGTNSVVYLAFPGAGLGTFNAVTSGLGTINSRFDWSFVQFDNLVFAACGLNGVLFHTAGSSTTMAPVSGLTGARDARVLGRVGRFLVTGHLGAVTSSPSSIAWSAIDQPTNWPTPNSATAIATQSGEQELANEDGPVVGIYGGDQHALIVQKSAITRMTYVGPPVVFQFDKIEQKAGSVRRLGHAASGQVVYLFATDGFKKTDGVSVVPIGDGRVDKTFIQESAIDSTDVLTAGAITEAGFDHRNRNIIWSFPSGVTTNANRLMVYSVDDDRWSYCIQVARTIIEPAPSSQTDGLYAFNSSNILCKFAGTAGTAIIETGDFEMNEAGRSYVDGVKPNVESSGTAPATTVRVGYRDDLGTTPSYTSTTSALARTGVANFRVDAKYVRFETQIVGNFDKATGIEVDAQPSSHA